MSDSSVMNSSLDFEEIKSVLTSTHRVYYQKPGDGPLIQRNLEDCHYILSDLEAIYLHLKTFFENYPSLDAVFQRDFGDPRALFLRENLIDLSLTEDYLFPREDKFPYVIEGDLDRELLDSYVLTIKDWADDVKDKHLETAQWISDQFDYKRSFKSLPCPCRDCLHAFRTKLRSSVFDDCELEIKETSDWINENIEDDIENISLKVFELRKKIDQKIHFARNQFKRSTITKLENQLRRKLLDHFASDSIVGERYTTRLKEYFSLFLKDEDLDFSLIEDSDYHKFFRQLGLELWRSPKVILKEFKKLVRSILLLKRQDISSQILQEYLGQFWLHSRARRMNRKIIYHMGPTNSGKTYQAIQELAKARTGSYLAPLRLLAGELYDTLNELKVPTTLLTGEEVIEMDHASHYSSTIEMAKLDTPFDCVVIDEIQMLSDPQRGWAWTRALVSMQSPVIHVCGDSSVKDLIGKILELTGDELEIKNYERMTELVVEPNPITMASLKKGDALIVFSRRNALKHKRDLEALGFKVSIIYGMLSPEVRREQARKFDHGETDILVSTDAIAMGMNLPIRRIVFSTLSKFIDGTEYVLSFSEIKQISGRAGRFGRFPQGFVNCLSMVDQGLIMIKQAINYDLKQKDQSMVGPDLEIFSRVNSELDRHKLQGLSLSEFLRLFNTMNFAKPFYCVDLREMIELAEMVEDTDKNHVLSSAEIFGFACAPVNLGLISHVQYYVWIINQFVNEKPIFNEPINYQAKDIDYLETAIKCTELYQWLSRHFDAKGFSFDLQDLLDNKLKAVEQLNTLLSQKIVRYCTSCGVKLKENFDFNICDDCFKARSFSRRPKRGSLSKASKSSSRPGKKRRRR